jgi:hypothetical protein
MKKAVIAAIVLLFAATQVAAETNPPIESDLDGNASALRTSA